MSSASERQRELRGTRAYDASVSQRLPSMLNPTSIAFIGASDRSHFSRVAFQNALDFGIEDKVHLVNRRGNTAHGRAASRNCAGIGSEIDLALVMVPRAATEEALSDAASAGASSAVLLSAGYAENGQEGAEAQARLVEHADALGLLLAGPNHVGFTNFVSGVPVCGISVRPEASGHVALVSQSGACASAMYAFASMNGVPLSYLLTLGNEAMVGAGHAIEFLIEDERTHAIAVFLETIRDTETFITACRRAIERGKTIVVLKTGSSDVAARVAAAHTGALVGDDRALGAVLEGLGVIRVETIEEMLLTAQASTYLASLDGSLGIGVVSLSGGAAGIVADRAADVGLAIPEFSDDTTAALSSLMPDYARAQNPMDLTGAALSDTSLFYDSIRIVSEDPAVGVTLVVSSLPWREDGRPWPLRNTLPAIREGIEAAQGPVVFVNQVVQPLHGAAKEALTEEGIPLVIAGLHQAVSIVEHVRRRGRALSFLHSEAIELPPTFVPPTAEQQKGAWSEWSSRRLFEECGIPVVPARLVHSADDAEDAARDFGGEVALKVVSANVPHKSDTGGVLLGVRGGRAVRGGYKRVRAAVKTVPGAIVEGVMVAPMRAPSMELLIGVTRNPQWGMILSVGFGGVFAEVLGDFSLATAPVSPAKAIHMLERLRGAKLLGGFRGEKKVDIESLAGVISRVSSLAVALGEELDTLEINPLRVAGSEIEALDTLVSWVSQ